MPAPPIDPLPKSTACPSCRAKGARVGAVTVESLATARALAALASREGFRFCATPSCEVVWFQPGTGAVLTRRDVEPRVGLTETAAPRPICYCFDHTVEQIEDEVARTGDSTIPAQITAKCGAGLDRCAQTNPSGHCCLGDVRAAVRQARERRTPQDGVTPPRRREPKGPGAWAVGGSLLSALLASACCWLPLAALALGVSSAGIGALLETWRPWLLGTCALFLGASFHLLFLRRPRCAPGASCKAPRPRPRRRDVSMFALSCALVGALAFFPKYVGALLGGTAATSQPASGRLATIELTVEGMTCEACAAVLRRALEDVAGVQGAEVDYASGGANVHTSDADLLASPAALMKAVEQAGYHATIGAGDGDRSGGSGGSGGSEGSQGSQGQGERAGGPGVARREGPVGLGGSADI